MSSTKRTINSTQSKTPSKITDPEVEKLLVIKQRDQLKDVLFKKLAEQFNSVEKSDNDFITKSVTEFLKHERLTKVIFRKMEQRLNAYFNGKGKGGKGSQAQSLDNIQQVGQQNEDVMSVTSSERPKSVYMQGDSDNEWATMLKYDTELYKKERALEELKEKELKKRTKQELDRQIAEKKRLKKEEEEEMKKYNHFVQKQLKQMDNIEKKKENDMKNKIMSEKTSRDQQLLEENLRKKQEKKVERELDQILVTKIRQQLDEEAKRAQVRRTEDKQQLKKLLQENELHKKRLAEVAKKEREADIKAQQEYTKLIEKQMAEREAEVKTREDRAKKFMSMMADTVVKNQRAQIIEEERILLKNHMDREARALEEERRRAKKFQDQKREVKNYLDQQVAEKKKKKVEELELEKKQVEFWKKETQDFKQQEKAKAEYIKEVNKKNAEFLKKQVQDEKKKYKEISPEELLFNKSVLREIANKHQESHFQKKLLKVNH